MTGGGIHHIIVPDTPCSIERALIDLYYTMHQICIIEDRHETIMEVHFRFDTTQLHLFCALSL